MFKTWNCTYVQTEKTDLKKFLNFETDTWRSKTETYELKLDNIYFMKISIVIKFVPHQQWYFGFFHPIASQFFLNYNYQFVQLWHRRFNAFIQLYVQYESLPSHLVSNVLESDSNTAWYNFSRSLCCFCFYLIMLIVSTCFWSDSIKTTQIMILVLIFINSCNICSCAILCLISFQMCLIVVAVVLLNPLIVVHKTEKVRKGFNNVCDNVEECWIQYFVTLWTNIRLHSEDFWWFCGINKLLKQEHLSRVTWNTFVCNWYILPRKIYCSTL